MLRTKIIVHPTTTPEEVLDALPTDFEGHVTFDVRERIQICIIHHWKWINAEMIYTGLNSNSREASISYKDPLQMRNLGSTKNWNAFCLYTFIKDHVYRAFFRKDCQPLQGQQRHQAPTASQARRDVEACEKHCIAGPIKARERVRRGDTSTRTASITVGTSSGASTAAHVPARRRMVNNRS